MSNLVVSAHGALRLAQRGFRHAELVEFFGTPVRDGYLMRVKDCQELEHHFKKMAQFVRRSAGKTLIVRDGRLVTCFHSRKGQQRRILRSAYASDLKSDYRE